MKKIGLVTMFFMVMAVVAAPVFAEITLNPAKSQFCDPTAKGFGDVNKPNDITATYSSASMFCDPTAKGFGDVSKSNGVFLIPGGVSPVPLNIFTGEPY